MKSSYSKDVYPELLDFDYRFLPGDWWDFRAEFDLGGLECKHCGSTYKVNPETVTCLECVEFADAGIPIGDHIMRLDEGLTPA